MSIIINNSYSEVHHLYFGVAQDSVLGPALFNIYVRSFYTLIENEGFEIKGFADNHQIYASFAPSFEHHYLVTKFNNIFSTVNIWTSKYFLKLNPRKSQIIIFCTETLKRQLKIIGFFLDNTCIRLSNTVSNSGFILDSHLNFKQQVNNCVSSIFASIKNIARIKYYLTTKKLSILVSSLIVSKLDYCNSLYYGIKSFLLKKSQYAQNCAAILIFNWKKFDHVTDLFYELRWLPARYRIQNKICLLTYKCINSTFFHILMNCVLSF